MFYEVNKLNVIFLFNRKMSEDYIEIQQFSVNVGVSRHEMNTLLGQGWKLLDGPKFNNLNYSFAIIGKPRPETDYFHEVKTIECYYPNDFDTQLSNLLNDGWRVLSTAILKNGASDNDCLSYIATCTRRILKQKN